MPLVFHFPEFSEIFMIESEIEFTLQTKINGTTFSWKTKNQRQVKRFLPIPVAEIYNYIKKQKSA